VGRSVVRVFDWDGDGLKDLVCSSDGGVYWCRNTNNNSNPILQAPVPICVLATTNLVPIVTGPVPGARMRLDLVDWNNDGVIDLILGNADGTVYAYEGQFRIGIVAQPGNNVALQWNSMPHLSYNVLTSDCVISVHNLAVANLPSGGTCTGWTNQMQDRPQFFRVELAP
jgi:hypothetical protein